MSCICHDSACAEILIGALRNSVVSSSLLNSNICYILYGMTLIDSACAKILISALLWGGYD